MRTRLLAFGAAGRVMHNLATHALSQGSEEHLEVASGNEAVDGIHAGGCRVVAEDEPSFRAR